MKSAAVAGLSASCEMQRPLISPTVAAPSIDGIGITSKRRSCTSRSSGTSARVPVIIPTLPSSNHSSGDFSSSCSWDSVSLGSRNRVRIVSRASCVLSSLNASEVGSVSSSKRSPPPEYTNGANPARVGSIATPLVLAERTRRELRRGHELVPAPPPVVGRDVEPADLHPVEVDHVLVVEDHLRRDAVRHALQAVVAAERLEGVAGVDVAEVDAALVEQGVDGCGQAVLDEPPQVAPRHEEHVGHGLAQLDRAPQAVVPQPGLHGHVGAVVDRVEVAWPWPCRPGSPRCCRRRRTSGRPARSGTSSARSTARASAWSCRRRRCRPTGPETRVATSDESAQSARHRRPHRCPPPPASSGATL